MAQLEEGYRVRAVRMMIIGNPFFSELGSDARYRDLMARLHLPIRTVNRRANRYRHRVRTVSTGYSSCPLCGFSTTSCILWRRSRDLTFMENIMPAVRGLAPAQIEQFITDGFVRIDHAFPRELADAARAILWKATGMQP